MSLARIRKGDTVMVISGDDKGKTGKVLRVFPDHGRVLVEGINMIKRHTKPGPQQQQGSIVEREAPIHLSKVLPVDPETGKGTRTRTRTEKDGSKSRIAKSGKTIENAPRA